MTRLLRSARKIELAPDAMTLSGVTRRSEAVSAGIETAGSLRIGTFEGSRPDWQGKCLLGIQSKK